MNRRAFLPLLPAAFFTGCGNDPQPAGSSESKTAGSSGQRRLIVGMDMTYPPFEFKNEKGELEAYAFDGLIQALKVGKVDVVISAMTATDERRKSIDFSDPYVFTALAMLVGKDSPIKSLDDLKKPGVRIIAKIGTTGESFTRESLPQAVLSLRDVEGVCVKEVGNGAADAFIYDQLSIYNHAKNNADKTRAILTPIREESWGIGIRKGNDELRGKVNAFIKDFREKGGLAALADKYLVEERKLLEGMGAPFIFR